VLRQLQDTLLFEPIRQPEIIEIANACSYNFRGQKTEPNFESKAALKRRKMIFLP